MLAELLVQAQQHHDQEATLHVLESFIPKIKASLRQVPADYQDDLKQELYVKMIEVIQTFDISELNENLERGCKKRASFLFIYM